MVPATPIPTPIPIVNPDTAEFWKAAADGSLLIKRCFTCDEVHWYPRPVCPFCHSDDTRWEVASGQGSIYTFSVVRRGRGEWKDATPYVIAYVELDEGPRVLTNIVGCDIDVLGIGDRVEVIFETADEHFAVPRFRPLGSRSDQTAGNH